jgi:hypothetical protein
MEPQPDEERRFILDLADPRDRRKRLQAEAIQIICDDETSAEAIERMILAARDERNVKSADS